MILPVLLAQVVQSWGHHKTPAREGWVPTESEIQMTTYSYEYTPADGRTRTVDGFDTQKDAATYLGRALHDNGYASKADAQKIARALRTKAGPIEMSGITATITCQESAE